MTQTDLNFSLPSLAELFPTDCQDRRLYQRLLEGGITNAEMRDELRLLSYTRRLSDLREKLKPHGYTINKYWRGNGVFIYRLEQTKQQAA